MQRIFTLTGILALSISLLQPATLAKSLVNQDLTENSLSIKNQNTKIAKRKIDGVMRQSGTSNQYIYIIENGKRKWVCNRRTLRSLGLDYKDVLSVTTQEFEQYPWGGFECLDGSLFNYYPNIYIIKNKQKRWVTTVAFKRLKLNKNNVEIMPSEFFYKIPTGKVIR
ncbi:hypothetical protein Cri9333_1013 [Crinalium epipsammum PCC 9333]|uniref:Lipoprotein n=1 Tax=Crinalium epipsammum PCC 9333 TaxID=1173022 RepID=K9VUZ2_9CYAN|nr:hypothetical protein [Crinalium epipsammum]AFZ11928.1 hypothetical protein Cri9333_1013 [Crinalium epipsammum PCC 9333]